MNLVESGAVANGALSGPDGHLEMVPVPLQAITSIESPSEQAAKEFWNDASTPGPAPSTENIEKDLEQKSQLEEELKKKTDEMLDAVESANGFPLGFWIVGAFVLLAVLR